MLEAFTLLDHVVEYLN